MCDVRRLHACLRHAPPSSPTPLHFGRSCGLLESWQCHRSGIWDALFPGLGYGMLCFQDGCAQWVMRPYYFLLIHHVLQGTRGNSLQRCCLLLTRAGVLQSHGCAPRMSWQHTRSTCQLSLTWIASHRSIS
jgi:hypothetical protein